MEYFTEPNQILSNFFFFYNVSLCPPTFGKRTVQKIKERETPSHALFVTLDVHEYLIHLLFQEPQMAFKIFIQKNLPSS